MFCKKGKRYSLNRRAAIGGARNKGVWVLAMQKIYKTAMIYRRW